jgi:hypothetical protein
MLLSLGRDMLDEIIGQIVENVKKSVNTINVKSRIAELTVNYLNIYTVILNLLFIVYNCKLVASRNQRLKLAININSSRILRSYSKYCLQASSY